LAYLALGVSVHLAALGLPATWSEPAAAQSYEAAQKLNDDGRAAYDRGEFPVALDLFKQAFALYPSERYLFNSAKACVRLADSEGAIYFYERYLTFNPMAKDRQAVESEVGRLKEMLRNGGLTEVRVVSNPPQAQVKVLPVRQTQVGEAPGTLFLPAGSYTLVFTLPGFKPKELAVDVAAGGQPQIVVEGVLERLEPGGILEVTCAEPGARVQVAGSYVGQTPLEPQELSPGDYVVTVSKLGFKSWNGLATVAAGKRTVAEAVLVADGAGTNPDGSGTPGLDGNGNAGADGKISGFPWRPVLFSVAGVAAATGLVGGYFWVDGWLGMDSANEDRPDITESAYLRRYGDARDSYVLGQWLAVCGGVAAVGSATAALLLHRPETSTPQVGVLPLPGGVSVGVGVVF
jgi:tetratricopeptide (TPR) repeat protein